MEQDSSKPIGESPIREENIIDAKFEEIKEEKDNDVNQKEKIENEIRKVTGEIITFLKSQKDLMDRLESLTKERLEIEKGEIKGTKMEAELNAELKSKKNIEPGEKGNENKNDVITEKERFSLKTPNEEVNKDIEKRPFFYFLASKVENPFLKEKFNKEGYIDLRKYATNGKNITFGEFDYLKDNEKEKGFFEFSLSGFVLEIKNLKELRESEEEKSHIRTRSEHGIYKIIGPDGSVIEDEVKGYYKAKQVFDEKIRVYEEKMREEFNKINSNK